MVLLIILFVAAFAVPFFAVLVLARALLLAADPKTRSGAILCFLIPMFTVLAGLISWGGASSVWRYSPQGPVIWFLVWPVLAAVCLGIGAAGFAVAAGRKRHLRSTHDGVATPTI
jgi:hypothetical protein